MSERCHGKSKLKNNNSYKLNILILWMKKRKTPKFYNFSFGVTSAIMTSLTIIIGLSGAASNITIITALLIIAIADNISDSFGIHIYQESKRVNSKEVKTTTANNFIARMQT